MTESITIETDLQCDKTSMYVCLFMYDYLLCTYCVNVGMHVYIDIVYITDMRINTYFIICLII